MNTPNFTADQLAQELERLKTQARAGLSGPAHSPATHALIDAALDAAQAAVPVSFEFAGRRWWLRMSLGLSFVEIFESPVDEAPALASFSSSTRMAGHRPGP